MMIAAFLDPAPKLIILLLATLIGFLSWGFWRIRTHPKGSDQARWDDVVLIGFLILASLCVGYFLDLLLTLRGSIAATQENDLQVMRFQYAYE